MAHRDQPRSPIRGVGTQSGHRVETWRSRCPPRAQVLIGDVLDGHRDDDNSDDRPRGADLFAPASLAASLFCAVVLGGLRMATTAKLQIGVTGRELPRGVRRGTIVAMSTEALRTVKDRFSEYVDRVENEHERVVVTRNGRPAIVLISTDDLASLEETISVLSDTDAIRALQTAEAAVAAGDVVRGVDAVRALRPPRQR